VRETGFQVDLCRITPGQPDKSELAAILCSRTFACVMIGAGLRKPPEHLLLFEKVLSLVHRLAPHACIAFNTTPADTAEAVRRWVTSHRGAQL
jgi:hypothetical protein